MQKFDLEKPIQDYINLLYDVDLSGGSKVTKERIRRNIEGYQKAFSFFLNYPDRFADIMTPRKSKFSLFFSQRIVLRAMARYRQSYFTFTRAFSKSFLAFYSRYTTCMFLPRHKAFVVAGSKKQAAQIAKEKVIDDLWVKFPLLANEMIKFRRANKLKTPYTESADSVTFNFPNRATFDVIGGMVRGGRRNSGIFEEVIDQDPVYINESVIPLLNINRLNAKGELNPGEPQSAKIFVTTAGYQGTFAFDKLIETLCLSVMDPQHYIIMGGSYVIPVMHGLLSEATMREILSSPSYRSDQVDREYRSIWCSSVVGAAFDANNISSLRRIKRAEFKAADSVLESEAMDEFYVVSCDIAKDGSANTAVIVSRVKVGEICFTYKFINLFTIDTTDFEVVANILKQTVVKYNAKLLVYDANGVGSGLRDWINKKTKTKSGLILDGLGIINPPSSAEDTVIKYRDKSKNIVYEIKSGGQKGSEIHSVFFGAIGNGRVRFLVKSAEAIGAFEQNANFALASKAKKDAVMRPYYYTDQMEMEMKNLDIKDNQDNAVKTIIITRRNQNIQKDFFSAAEYLIYATMQQIELPYYKNKRDKERRRNMIKISGAMNNNTGGKSLSSRRRKR